MPKGQWQVYQWVTIKSGKADGSYNTQEMQTEFEYGITDRLQFAYYLMYNAYQIDNVTRSGKKFSNEGLKFRGMKAHLKWNVISPYLNDYGFGLGFYIEPGFGLLNNTWGTPKQDYWLETKILLQKNFFNDRAVSVLNVVNKFTRSVNDKNFTDSIDMVFTGGLTYLLVPNWYVGMEGRIGSSAEATILKNMITYSSEFAGMRNWTLHLGPTVNYAGQKWWFTVTFFPQIWGNRYQDLKAAIPELNLKEGVAFEFRFKFGYNS